MEEQSLLLAYLAGCMDSDGSFGIRRDTYHLRVRGDSTVPIFSERICFKQVCPIVPQLLKNLFGGHLYKDKPNAKHGRSLWGWEATQLLAAKCILALYPYLRVKKPQAEILIKLRESKNSQTRPRWRTDEERQKILTYHASLFEQIRAFNDIRSQKPKLI